MMDDILGFPVGTTAGGEFTGIIKYHAPSGRIFRVDRENTGNGWVTENVDITANFKAVMDLDNIQSGWLYFMPGAPPSFALVPLAALEAKTVEKPPQPSANHKQGVRFRLKLAKGCSGEGNQIRELAGFSNAFLNGIQPLYRQYKADRGKYPGQLPVVVLQSTMLVASGKASNYQPTWRIDGWAPRPADLKNEISQPAMAPVAPLPPPMTADDFDAPKIIPETIRHTTAPRTGGNTVPPPNLLHAVPLANVHQANALHANNLDDDFG